MTELITTFFIWSQAAVILMAQSGTGLIGTGYTPPRPLPAAPGQVLTLYVRGLKASPIRATGQSLPTTLSGVAVTVEEPSRSYKAGVPIFSIDAVHCGSGLRYICDVAAITIQMPVDLLSCQPSGGSSSCSGPAPHPLLTIMENGMKITQIEFVTADTNIHVLNSCDTLIGLNNLACVPFATHGDGTVITGSNPGRPSEEIIVYAVGLGATTPVVTAGSPAGIPAPVATAPIVLNFDFRPDAQPSIAVGDDRSASPVFAGLAPGFTGLYQVNLTLPSSIPAEARTCAGSERSTNVTITLASRSSFDGLQICMQAAR